MNRLHLVLAITVTVAMGSLQAAGTMKAYNADAAFAADDVVDWIALGASPRGEKAIQVPRTFSAKSATGAAEISGSLPAGNLRRVDEGVNFFGNFYPGERLLSTNGNPGPLTITFTSGAVMGVAVQILSEGPGTFTGRMTAYDAAGNLLGTMTVTGAVTSVRPADNTAPFMGLRSSLKEIARVDIDAPGAPGFAVNSLRLANNPVSIANNVFFVYQLFQDLYGRAPTGTEMADNVTPLNLGTSARAQVASALFNGGEFHDNAAYVVKCYLGLMQRDADFDGWSRIFKLMHDGATQGSVLAGFMGTPEYGAAYPDGLSDADFVTRLHQNILGRGPDGGELDSWTSNLAQGGSRADVAQALLTGAEFDGRVGNRVNANLVYLAFLRRGGDPGGLDSWTDALKSGTALTDVIGAVIATPEYAARF